MGGRAGGGARGGKAAGGGAQPRDAFGNVDYLAMAGISDKDVMKVFRRVNSKINPTEKQKAAAAAKAARVEGAFNEVYDMLKSGRFAPASRRKK